MTMKCCKKIIHPFCLKDWLREKYKKMSLNDLNRLESVELSCPLCRADLDVSNSLEIFFSSNLKDLLDEMVNDHSEMNKELLIRARSLFFREFSPLSRKLLLRGLLREYSSQNKRLLIDEVMLPSFNMLIMRLKREKRKNQSCSDSKKCIIS